jgi:hypothetical protein
MMKNNFRDLTGFHRFWLTESTLIRKDYGWVRSR